MAISEQHREDLRSVLDKGVMQRFPVTFLPFVNQQIREWGYLFPNERQSLEELLNYVAKLNADESSALFRDVIQLEEKMGVRHWGFSTTEQTIENASELARSPYYQEWRRAIQTVFDAVDRDAIATNSAAAEARHRLVILDIPRTLVVSPSTVWRRWQGIGKPVSLKPSTSDSDRGFLEFLLTPSPGESGAFVSGLLNAPVTPQESSSADKWFLDAGEGLNDSSWGPAAPTVPSLGFISLSYGRLGSYRETFSHEMNTMRKDLADADDVLGRLRKVDVTAWCPPEVAADPAVKEFVRSLFLSGNGAVLFGNSFVEWGASEAFRRARPTLVAARFGMRAKPKPFTGVAVFDDPNQINPAPSVDDVSGSTADAEILALYVWLAATRYAEYQSATACVVLAESISQAYVIAPSEFPLWHEAEPVSRSSLKDALCNWMA